MIYNNYLVVYLYADVFALPWLYDQASNALAFTQDVPLKCIHFISGLPRTKLINTGSSKSEFPLTEASLAANACFGLWLAAIAY